MTDTAASLSAPNSKGNPMQAKDDASLADELEIAFERWRSGSAVGKEHFACLARDNLSVIADALRRQQSGEAVEQSPLEASPVDVERVALLALLQHQRAKVPDTQQSRHSVKGLDAAIAALQSPPVEQPAQAEAQQPSERPNYALEYRMDKIRHDQVRENVREMEERAEIKQASDGLVEELAACEIAPFPHSLSEYYVVLVDEGLRNRILAALKARTSPETVELLREARDCIACDNDLRGADSLEPGVWTRSDAAELVYRIDAHLSNTPDQGSMSVADGRCPNCGEDEMDGARCHYCGYHEYACDMPDCTWCNEGSEQHG